LFPILELCDLTLHVTADCICDGDGYGMSILIFRVSLLSDLR
jgi:hypothetical protein